MPSHRSDLKISLPTEEVAVEDSTADIKPKVERKYYIGFGTGGKKLGSQYKAAINLVVKARKNKENLDSKRRLWMRFIKILNTEHYQTIDPVWKSEACRHC